jgi:hypothetical protein
MRYVLSWKAPEGEVASADLDGTTVADNHPVPCRTAWFAALLGAKIAYANESLTQRVVEAATRLDTTELGREVEVNGWTFLIERL